MDCVDCVIKFSSCRHTSVSGDDGLCPGWGSSVGSTASAVADEANSRVTVSSTAHANERSRSTFNICPLLPLCSLSFQVISSLLLCFPGAPRDSHSPGVPVCGEVLPPGGSSLCRLYVALADVFVVITFVTLPSSSARSSSRPCCGRWRRLVAQQLSRTGWIPIMEIQQSNE